MNLSEIPRIFWYSVSLCLVILTGTSSYVIWKSENLEIQYKDFNLRTSEQVIKEKLIEDVNSILREREIFDAEKLKVVKQMKDLSASDSASKDFSENHLIEINSTLLKQQELASQQIQRLQEVKEEIVSLTPESTTVEKNSGLVFDGYWAKAGYFLQIEKDVRLNVNRVGKDSVTVDVSGLQETTIQAGKSAIFSGNNGRSYKVLLLRIGGAGTNRFKKAGYFKVEVMDT